MRLLHQLRQDGTTVPNIISLVERQLRLLALGRELIDQGVRQQEVGVRLGLKPGFVTQKTYEQARRHSWKAINWSYQRLLEADLSIKQGRMTEDLALEVLVGELAGRR